MKAFRTFTREQVAAGALWRAAQGSYDGMCRTVAVRRYLDDCMTLFIPDGVRILLTRDVGMHTCGHWKNPDYNRCLHLSLSFVDPATGLDIGKRLDLTEVWVDLIFGATKNLIWTESPKSDEGKIKDVWHYRVFYGDPEFRFPILPRGEVYTKEFTEAGWLSWSDARAAEQKRAARAMEIIGNAV